MSDQAAEKVEVAAPVVDAPEAPIVESKAEQPEVVTKEAEEKVEDKPKDASETAAPDAGKPAQAEVKTTGDGDTEMVGTTVVPVADESTATPAAKNTNRRKSGAASANNRKTLSKKQSKAKITNLDAKPGDHFLVKLKGFPEWPVIIADESMLPEPLLTSRPVTAAKPDGTFAENYADGGKRVNDRNFPIMYLSTNEFGWIINSALTELSAEKAAESAKKDKMRKDLKSAFELAAEHYPIDYYKDIIAKFEEELVAFEEAAKAAAATPKKSKKGKAKADAEDDDVEMADPIETVKIKTKKRKAEDDASTPQRSESAKKPKIKLNTNSTPKTANGTAATKDASAKGKTKAAKKEVEKKPEISPEERHKRKEKEVLYLRHKLQRGLLTRDQQPQEAEMDQMADYIKLLEGFADLEVSIIRSTKINKVLKAILKLDTIPREEEFRFKPRSQSLLEKWNKLMASDSTPAPAAATNGVNGDSEFHDAEKDEAKKDKTEEKKDDGDTIETPKDSESEKPKETEPAAKEIPAEPEKAEEKEAATEEAKTTATAEPVEAAA